MQRDRIHSHERRDQDQGQGHHRNLERAHRKVGIQLHSTNSRRDDGIARERFVGRRSVVYVYSGALDILHVGYGKTHAKNTMIDAEIY